MFRFIQNSYSNFSAKYFFLLFISGVSYCQSLNDYKYLVMKKQYGFQSEINEYRLNSNARFMLKEQGFQVLFDDEILPEDLAKDRCKAMYLDMALKDAFMAIKLGVTIKDCHNKVLYGFPDGVSKEKSKKEAYNEALKMSLNSVKSLNYKYVGSETIVNTIETSTPEKVLSAIAVTNGFQLNDSQGNVVMTILKTSQKECFLANRNAVNGVLILKDYKWFFEYYQEDKLISEEVKVFF